MHSPQEVAIWIGGWLITLFLLNVLSATRYKDYKPSKHDQGVTFFLAAIVFFAWPLYFPYLLFCVIKDVLFGVKEEIPTKTHAPEESAGSHPHHTTLPTTKQHEKKQPSTQRSEEKKKEKGEPEYEKVNTILKSARERTTIEADHYRESTEEKRKQIKRALPRSNNEEPPPTIKKVEKSVKLLRDHPAEPCKGLINLLKEFLQSNPSHGTSSSKLLYEFRRWIMQEKPEFYEQYMQCFSEYKLWQTKELIESEVYTNGEK